MVHLLKQCTASLKIRRAKKGWNEISVSVRFRWFIWIEKRRGPKCMPWSIPRYQIHIYSNILLDRKGSHIYFINDGSFFVCDYPKLSISEKFYEYMVQLKIKWTRITYKYQKSLNLLILLSVSSKFNLFNFYYSSPVNSVKTNHEWNLFDHNIIRHTGFLCLSRGK